MRQKSPKHARGPVQIAPSRRDLSIGTRHAAREGAKGRETKTRRPQNDYVLYISELAPRAWSGMTGVVNSLKLRGY